MTRNNERREEKGVLLRFSLSEFMFLLFFFFFFLSLSVQVWRFSDRDRVFSTSTITISTLAIDEFYMIYVPSLPSSTFFRPHVNTQEAKESKTNANAKTWAQRIVAVLGIDFVR
jgi:hypothetical protein